MAQIPRIKLNREFSSVYRRGQKVHTHSVILHSYRRKGQTGIRFGVTTSHGVRTAVRRNRLKRLLREAFRREAPRLKSGYDVILTARDLDPPADLKQISRDLRYALRKAGLYGEPEETK